MPRKTKSAGFTLIEVMIGVAVMGAMIATMTVALSAQANLFGVSADAHRVLVPAQVCLQRVQNELKTAVRATPGYAVSGTSISFRPLVGYIPSTDPNYTAKNSAGLISSSSIEYAAYVKTISYDAVNKRVLLTATGTLAPGVRPSETLCENVEVFQFADGENTTATPPAAVAATRVILVRVEVSRVSAAPGAKGALASSTVAGRVLSTKVRVFPELLVNSSNGAVVGP